MMMVERFDDLYETYLGGDINYLPMELSSSNSSPASDKDECFWEMILIQFASTNLFSISLSLSLSPPPPFLSPTPSPSPFLSPLPLSLAE